MGKVKNNVITKGFSGKYGDDLLFRQVDNQTIFVRRTLTKAAPSASQTQVRNNFTQASLFASAAIENPDASVEYKLMAEAQGLKSAYLAAVTDYLTMPEIGGVYTASYKGVSGNIINIKPKTPYKIVAIDVSIVLPDDTIVETGPAIAHELKWRYVATAANPAVAGSKLVLLARDRQGKEIFFEQML